MQAVSHSCGREPEPASYDVGQKLLGRRRRAGECLAALRGRRVLSASVSICVRPHKMQQNPRDQFSARTEQNVVDSYISETQAYARYTITPRKPKDGYFPLKEVFEETAANELRHGKGISEDASGWRELTCNIPPMLSPAKDTVTNLEISST